MWGYRGGITDSPVSGELHSGETWQKKKKKHLNKRVMRFLTLICEWVKRKRETKLVSAWKQNFKINSSHNCNLEGIEQNTVSVYFLSLQDLVWYPESQDELFVPPNAWKPNSKWGIQVIRRILEVQWLIIRGRQSATQAQRCDHVKVKDLTDIKS